MANMWLYLACLHRWLGLRFALVGCVQSPGPWRSTRSTTTPCRGTRCQSQDDFLLRVSGSPNVESRKGVLLESFPISFLMMVLVL